MFPVVDRQHNVLRIHWEHFAPSCRGKLTWHTGRNGHLSASFTQSLRNERYIQIPLDSAIAQDLLYCDLSLYMGEKIVHEFKFPVFPLNTNRGSLDVKWSKNQITLRMVGEDSNILTQLNWSMFDFVVVQQTSTGQYSERIIKPESGLLNQPLLIPFDLLPSINPGQEIRCTLKVVGTTAEFITPSKDGFQKTFKSDRIYNIQAEINSYRDKIQGANSRIETLMQFYTELKEYGFQDRITDLQLDFETVNSLWEENIPADMIAIVAVLSSLHLIAICDHVRSALEKKRYVELKKWLNVLNYVAEARKIDVYHGLEEPLKAPPNAAYFYNHVSSLLLHVNFPWSKSDFAQLAFDLLPYCGNPNLLSFCVNRLQRNRLDNTADIRKLLKVVTAMRRVDDAVIEWIIDKLNSGEYLVEAMNALTYLLIEPSQARQRNLLASSLRRLAQGNMNPEVFRALTDCVLAQLLKDVMPDLAKYVETAKPEDRAKLLQLWQEIPSPEFFDEIIAWAVTNYAALRPYIPTWSEYHPLAEYARLRAEEHQQYTKQRELELESRLYNASSTRPPTGNSRATIQAHTQALSRFREQIKRRDQALAKVDESTQRLASLQRQQSHLRASLRELEQMQGAYDLEPPPMTRLRQNEQALIREISEIQHQLREQENQLTLIISELETARHKIQDAAEHVEAAEQADEEVRAILEADISFLRERDRVQQELNTATRHYQATREQVITAEAYYQQTDVHARMEAKLGRELDNKMEFQATLIQKIEARRVTLGNDPRPLGRGAKL